MFFQKKFKGLMDKATPLYKLERLSNQLQIDLWVKRDDLFPFTGGGNKARKIDYIVDDAISKKCNAFVTAGGVQSNHARVVALKAASLGWPCKIVIHAEPGDDHKKEGNLLLVKLSGAEYQIVPMDKVVETMDLAMEEYKNQGKIPYYIWGGGHCVQGSLAYYEAAKEAQKQCGDWIPDYVVHASGTGTTQAGLIAGYADSSTEVIGISVAREKKRGEQVVKESLVELGDFLKKDYSASIVNFRDDWIMGGYEKTSPELIETINQAALKGLILDPTYTGKAYMGMKELIEGKELPIGSKVLFWHTGGLLNLLSSPEYLK